MERGERRGKKRRRRGEQEHRRDVAREGKMKEEEKFDGREERTKSKIGEEEEFNLFMFSRELRR